MRTEYLDKCWHLLNWQESANEVALWEEMDGVRNDLVQLSVLFSNELILNLIEASSREQMLRVIETYVFRVSSGTNAPIEFVCSVDSFDDVTYKPFGGNEYIKATGYEQYMLNCYHLMTFLTNEIEIISRIYGFELASIIEGLSARLVKCGMHNVDYMDAHLTGVFKRGGFADKPQRIKWMGSDEQLTKLVGNLMLKDLIDKSDIAEFISVHFGNGTVGDGFKRIEWHQTLTLLSHLVERLVEKKLIHPVNPFADFEKHFLRNGKPVRKLSTTNNQASEIVRGSDIIKEILDKL